MNEFSADVLFCIDSGSTLKEVATIQKHSGVAEPSHEDAGSARALAAPAVRRIAMEHKVLIFDSCLFDFILLCVPGVHCV